MRRINWKTVSTLMAIGLVASCSETVVQPKQATLRAPATTTMSNAPQGRPVFNMTTTDELSGTRTFTVSPSGGVFHAGNASISFPANSICDPAVSSYGEGTWDAGCTPLTSAIKITAVTRRENGLAQVDFTPSLRFVPSNDPSRWVWLSISVPSLAGTSDLEAFKIYFRPTANGPMVDESARDQSLRTYADPDDGISQRRVKHFSGYAVAYKDCPPGETCPDSSTTP